MDALLEVMLAFVWDFVCECVVELAGHSAGRVVRGWGVTWPPGVFLLIGVVGASVAVFTLDAFDPLVESARWRGVVLVATPVVSGASFGVAGSVLRGPLGLSTAGNRFVAAFCLVLAFVGVRYFAFA